MKVTDLVEAIKADLPKKNKLEKIAAVFSHFSPSQFGGSLNTFRFISFSTIDKKPEQIEHDIQAKLNISKSVVNGNFKLFKQQEKTDCLLKVVIINKQDTFTNTEGEEFKFYPVEIQALNDIEKKLFKPKPQTQAIITLSDSKKSKTKVDEETIDPLTRKSKKSKKEESSDSDE